MKRFPDEQLTPRMLAQKLDLFRRDVMVWTTSA